MIMKEILEQLDAEATQLLQQETQRSSLRAQELRNIQCGIRLMVSAYEDVLDRCSMIAGEAKMYERRIKELKENPLTAGKHDHVAKYNII